MQSPLHTRTRGPLVPGAKLTEATPDLVGLTDIVGCSRQYLRKLMIVGGTKFPEPVHDGKSALWRLSKILLWLRECKRYDIEDKVLDVATMNMRLNIVREVSEIDELTQAGLRGLIN